MTLVPTHKTASEMIEKLVSYLQDNGVIQRSVHQEFGWKPSIRQIVAARQSYEAKLRRYDKSKNDVSFSLESDRLFVEEIKMGTKLLRERIIERHPNIMKALEARGNMVVWNG